MWYLMHSISVVKLPLPTPPLTLPNGTKGNGMWIPFETIPKLTLTYHQLHYNKVYVTKITTGDISNPTEC